MNVEHGYVRIGDKIFEITTISGLEADAVQEDEDAWFMDSSDYRPVEIPDEDANVN